MRELDKELSSIQKKGTNVKLIISFIVLIGIAAYIAILLLAKGFTVKVFPEEAEKTKQISVISGTGFTLGESVYKLGDSIVVQVGAVKYQSKELALSSNDNEIVEVELVPTPGKIMATTSPEDQGTNWRIDGSLVHVGETFEHELLPGNYDLSIENKFAEPIIESIEIKSEEVNELLYELTPIEGVLKLSSIPFGADVEINGESAGNTPVSISVSGGYFDIIVSKEGFEDTVETIEVSNEKRAVARNYKLEPKKALLHVNVAPNDGLLLINGLSVQQTSNYLNSNQQHQIVYEKDGFFPFQDKLTLKPGQEKTLDIKLKPEFGNVTVKASPNADIYINGKRVANKSYNTKLQAVEHLIEVKKQGYRTVVKKVKPTSKRTSILDVELLTEFDARRKEGKPLFISKLGINMTTFTMDPFTMGSPANEKGRKRNEHQVKVDFSMPVMISKHEITEKQFSAFAPDWPKSDNPVTEVSWEDAAVYCNWLSEQEGLPMFYIEDQQGNIVGFNKEAKGYRLPTEAEWEWLARAANRATPTKYTWGNLDRVAKDSGNYGDQSLQGQQTFTLDKYNDGHAGVAPVGSFKADRVGMYDIAGNVSEWVHDYYTHAKPNTSIVHTDYMGISRGSSHVVKGSNYKTGRIDQLRSAYRQTATKASKTIGFRIARYQ